ncbi:MAG: porphobilinogen synthase [Terriglobales bacterium]
MFPVHRPRRLRDHPALRAMTRETRLHREQLICPLFGVPGNGVRQEIASLPGQFHLSVDRLAEEAKAVAGAGIPAVLLFGLPASKDDAGSGAWIEDGIVQQAIRAVKRAAPELAVITDLCLCEYTTHGHCGVLTRDRGGTRVDNDSTLPVLARIAVSQAEAGADMVAPSDMMDGRVAAIRRALDGAGFTQLPILSYAAKQASAFYGPFREAANSAPQEGDRAGYQMDPANAREALREMQADWEEGADVLMVKPALPCLDILRQARRRLPVPLAAYQVSGEYAMIEAAAARGWLDRERAMWETLTAIHRAGADWIITYYAQAAARGLKS